MMRAQPSSWVTSTSYVPQATTWPSRLSQQDWCICKSARYVMACEKQEAAEWLPKQVATKVKVHMRKKQRRNRKEMNTETKFTTFDALAECFEGWSKKTPFTEAHSRVFFQRSTLHLQHNTELHNQVGHKSGAVSNCTQQAVVSRVQNRYCWLLPQIAQNSVSTPEA